MTGPLGIDYRIGGMTLPNRVVVSPVLTYQATPDDMVYFTYAEGYRIGGATPPLPIPACGKTPFPTSYNSDNLDNDRHHQHRYHEWFKPEYTRQSERHRLPGHDFAGHRDRVVQRQQYQVDPESADSLG